jgi:PAS domain S-box-containing protein
MSSTTVADGIDDRPDAQNLLDEPEQTGLLRMTKLVEHVFDVPIAYFALLGPNFKVVTRIGSGSAHWNTLKTYPPARPLANPTLWPDPSGAPVAGFICGDVRFAAAAPLRSSDGLELGLLVIADVRPRPEFSKKGLGILEELAGILAGKMELRLLACTARESERLIQEAESRFRDIANCAPIMIICSGVDGGASFVNKRWLEFTGRTIAEELGDGFAETFHPDYRDHVMTAYWDAFEARQPLTLQFPMRRYDGEYRWMETRGRPLFLNDGTCAGYIGCFIELAESPSPPLTS